MRPKKRSNNILPVIIIILVTVLILSIIISKEETKIFRAPKKFTITTEPSNLLVNGNFETSGASNSLLNWETNKYVQSGSFDVFTDTFSGASTTNPNERYDGTHSFRLMRSGALTDTAWALKYTPYIQVTPGNEYLLRFWTKHNKELTTLTEWQGVAKQRIAWYDSSRRFISETTFVFGRSEANWHKMERKSIAPNNAAYAKVEFGFDYPQIYDGAYIYIDSVYFAPASPTINFPSSRYSTSQNRPTISATYKDNSNTGLNLAIVKLFLDGNDVTSQASISSSGISYTPSTALSNGCHNLRLEVSDNAGANSIKKSVVGIENKPGASISSIRDDRTILIDNYPFFPVGMFSVWTCPDERTSWGEIFPELRDAKFNSAQTYYREYDSYFQGFLDSVNSYGFKALVYPAQDLALEDLSCSLWNNMNHPSMSLWYLVDEPEYMAYYPDMVQEWNNIVKGVDPYHLTSLVIGNEEKYSEYVNIPDVFMVDPYPIVSWYNYNILEVANRIEDAKTAMQQKNVNKPIIAILQAFGQNPAVHSYNAWGWDREPTYEEEKAMTYLAIVHGAKGIYYYTYAGGAYCSEYRIFRSPQHWNEVKSIVSELGSIKDVLVSYDSTTSYTNSNSNIHTLIKQTEDGTDYLIAVNTLNQQQTANFNINSLGNRIVYVLSEGRTIQASNGRFSDNFNSYGVHVYSLREPKISLFEEKFDTPLSQTGDESWTVFDSAKIVNDMLELNSDGTVYRRDGIMSKFNFKREKDFVFKADIKFENTNNLMHAFLEGGLRKSGSSDFRRYGILVENNQFKVQIADHGGYGSGNEYRYETLPLTPIVNEWYTVEFYWHGSENWANPEIKLKIYQKNNPNNKAEHTVYFTDFNPRISFAVLRNGKGYVDNINILGPSNGRLNQNAPIFIGFSGKKYGYFIGEQVNFHVDNNFAPGLDDTLPNDLYFTWKTHQPIVNMPVDNYNGQFVWTPTTTGNFYFTVSIHSINTGLMENNQFLVKVSSSTGLVPKKPVMPTEI